MQMRMREGDGWLWLTVVVSRQPSRCRCCSSNASFLSATAARVPAIRPPSRSFSICVSTRPLLCSTHTYHRPNHVAVVPVHQRCSTMTYHSSAPAGRSPLVALLRQGYDELPALLAELSPVALSTSVWHLVLVKRQKIGYITHSTQSVI